MAYTTINKSTDYFNTLLYTGDGTSPKARTGVGFQPDWVWSKTRSSVKNHQLIDSVRGADKTLQSNVTDAEGNQFSYGYLQSFDSDGFTSIAGSSAPDNWNGNGTTYVAWNWKAGGGQGSSNTDGSINTTYTSVNTTAGFSICYWSGTGANATIGHGLGAVPKIIITKSMASVTSWCVYHASLGNTKTIFLESNGTGNTHVAYYNNTSPTSSVFTVGTDSGVNHSGNNMIAYCFAEKTGYSKFGSYTGNGNADGTFVYTGFRPAWVMSKRTDSSDGWRMRDSKRDIDNPAQHRLLANASDAEVSASSQDTDFLSNGFKIRNSDSGYNASGGTYIYMAFGQSLVGSNNIPCTAR